jgi:hypothetical protein
MQLLHGSPRTLNSIDWKEEEPGKSVIWFTFFRLITPCDRRTTWWWRRGAHERANWRYRREDMLRCVV